MALYRYLTGRVNSSQFGKRLDQALTQLFPNYSRSQIKSWILDGLVKVNGRVQNMPKKKYLAENVLK